MQKLSTWYRKVGFFGLDGSNCIDDRLVDYPALSAFCHTSVQRQNLHSYNSLVGGNRKSYKAAKIVNGRISLNFHIKYFANVKCRTFAKLQFLIVFCKTLLSHYIGVSRALRYSTVTDLAKFLGWSTSVPFAQAT